tara:strand:+ start:165 stop:413 length:249 start_codon:yes stop_codon:yes gene_type:complete
VALAFAERLRRWLKCRRISVIVIVIVFVMLFLISLTEKSIAESARKSTYNLILLHFIKESFFYNFCYLALLGTALALKASFF